MPRSLTRPQRSLILAPEHLAAITAQAWMWCPLETGGLLLGYTHDNHTFVTHVIGPGPNATHSGCRFEPDDTWQAAEVARIWHTDPTIAYLGDWHTHPGGSPKPSSLDRATLRQIAVDPGARQGTPIMLIVALNDRGSSTPAAVQRRADQRITSIAIRVPKPTDNP